MPKDHRFHELTVNLLGTISTKLRDLKGIRTLANEFIQNAEDAENATSIKFNFCDDALYVYNDGVFRDIDFYRLKRIASGGKRDEEGTIGAFGVGFLSVYQITDAPEVISNGKHWIIEPHKDKNHIKEHSAGETLGTTFRLPWAYNPDSSMRKELREQIVSKDKIDEWTNELVESLPNALLFLNKINNIKLYKDNEEQLCIERIINENQILIGTKNNIQIWHVYEGSFKEMENNLRQKYSAQIDKKRTSFITIAVSDSFDNRGYIFAGLPTQMKTNLPVHINADFFPTSDRKSIIMESDYQSEWNRAALECAAQTLTDNLEEIKHAINYKNIWALIQSTYDLNNKANQDEVDSVFKCFWVNLQPTLLNLPIFYSINDNWVLASEIKLLEKETENNAIPLLMETAINILHPNLKRYHNLMRELKVRYLEIWDIISLLQNEGLTKPFTREKMPRWLKIPDNLTLLWEECYTLLNNQRVAGQYESAKDDLASCTLIPGTDGLIHPAHEIYRANIETVELFTNLPGCIFVKINEPKGDKLFEILCDEFTPQIAIVKTDDYLSKDLNLKFLDEYAILFIKWFEQNVYKPDEDLKLRLTELPIYPAKSGEYYPLTKLVLPGGFEDPLHITNIIDTDTCKEVIDFIKMLGIKELTLIDYLQNHVLPALESNTLQEDLIKAIVHILAMKLEMINNNTNLRDRLAKTPLVLKTNGEMSPAEETYLPTPEVLDILGNNAPIVNLPPTDAERYQDLYIWLGVAQIPRPVDIIKKIRILTDKPAIGKSQQSIEVIIKHLSRLYQQQEFDENEWSELKQLEWLPVKNETKWYKPEEVYTTFQEYLFSTQGLFINITRSNQAEGAKLLEYIGVINSPSIHQVVDHLIKMAELNKPVNTEVYTYLNLRYDAPELKMLLNKSCILLEGKYFSSEQVFWNEHPFGKRRLLLGAELRKYHNLLTALGVKDKPNFEDAILVLRELSEEYGAKNKIISEEAYNIVISCWKLLSEEVDLDEVINHIKTLSSENVIPNRQNLLYTPTRLFFTDTSIIQPKILNFLQHNLIDKIHGAWQAMQIAGVLPLKEKVKIDIIELDNPETCVIIPELINIRINQLIRCLDGMQYLTKSKEEIHNRLNEINYLKVQNIELEWSIKIGSQRETEQGSVSAYFCEDDLCIYYRSNKDSIPWTAIAREIAISINSGDDIGQIASGIKEVLKAESSSEAEQILDELGYPRVKIMDTTTPTETVISLGNTNTEETGIESSYNSKEQFDKAPLIKQASEAEANFYDSSKQRRSAEVSKTKSEEIKETNVVKSKSPTQKKSRLRTYVINKNAYTEKCMTTEDKNERKKLDKSGVERVVEHESFDGRKPEVMDHHNPGYDIKSYDPIVNDYRYIEVKSISNTWDRSDIGLTSTQFMKALELKGKYWLYVAEQPYSNNCKIYRIQDPASKVDQFLFDGGWQAVSDSSID